ncbi:Fe-S cluster assembly protein SufD [Pseudoxanthomonas broegbernensis]|uniref:Fe-S cluster assembly protein SufD n=1 Tax=Pseudoxanthomonas broegbernensis TaxID=83619 RepID=A0A7V8K8K0_9GAMM|nr:Fe-S cluster assembly protein SufD [Pseudoxanthomonas broegbernensis]KAF1688191.1 Fe-S cluster assembly protein SufD [Pseudoxanthomonas broegbernensis]MBB6065245.1 Fe-S cluster assembly protein SufD [Pseudoxanthomonas broegbernensis]
MPHLHARPPSPTRSPEPGDSRFLESFRTSFDALGAPDAQQLGDTRRQALDALLADGLPGPREEAWKYTPLRMLERRAFAAADPAPPAFDPALLEGIPAPRLVFVNGRHDAAHSDLSGLPEGAVLEPLSHTLAGGEPRDVGFLQRRYDHRSEVFARANAALADEGVVLRLEAGVRLPAPLHLVFVGVPQAGDRAWHLRHFLDLRNDAGLDIVEHQLAAGEHAHLANEVLHLHLGQRAAVRHARIQADAARATRFARTDAVLARDARYQRIDLELGAALSRHELNVRLEGDGARLVANGVLFGDGRRHVDTRLGIEHIARDTACELLWRGIADGRSRVVFHGGIGIRAGADGTDAALSNKNLLLSADAEIDTQPVLVIDADEVKAAHGATVGQLDANALFYMRSRGIPEAQAQRLMTLAFCREPLLVLEDDGLRKLLLARLDAALAAALGTGEPA